MRTGLIRSQTIQTRFADALRLRRRKIYEGGGKIRWRWRSNGFVFKREGMRRGWTGRRAEGLSRGGGDWRSWVRRTGGCKDKHDGSQTPLSDIVAHTPLHTCLLQGHTLRTHICTGFILATVLIRGFTRISFVHTAYMRAGAFLATVASAIHSHGHARAQKLVVAATAPPLAFTRSRTLPAPWAARSSRLTREWTWTHTYR